MTNRGQNSTHPPQILPIFSEAHKRLAAGTVYDLTFNIYDPRQSTPPTHRELPNVRGVDFESVGATLVDT